MYQFLWNFPFDLCDLIALIGTWAAALSFPVLVSFNFLFPPPSAKLLYWLFLPFLFPSDLATFEFLSLECLLLLADLRSSFFLGQPVSNFFSLFLLVCLPVSFSWESELLEFLHSGLQRKQREERTLIQLLRNNKMANKCFSQAIKSYRLAEEFSGISSVSLVTASLDLPCRFCKTI